MTYHPSQEEWAKVRELGSSFNYMWIGNRCCVHLVDDLTSTPWHQAYGPDERTAIRKVLETAGTRNQPMTAAQIAAEHMSQADKINQLETKLDDLAPKKTRKRKPRTPSPEEDGFDDTKDTD